jgi:predicted HTH transcriptional regulator
MISKITIDEIIKIIESTPEQSSFDWKTDFVLPTNDEKKGEIIKDISAIANASPVSYGFLLYGVDPRKSDPVLGISTNYDDSKLQQLVTGKIDPPVEFLYYEVSMGTKVVAVIQVAPTRRRPHIISVDLGKIRKGQIVIRRGSSTDGITLKDLIEFFYGQTSGYFPTIIQHLQANTQQQLADIEYMRELREQANQALRDMEITLGAPRGSLGAKW